jgi:hypothetical protein
MQIQISHLFHSGLVQDLALALAISIEGLWVQFILWWQL